MVSKVDTFTGGQVIAAGKAGNRRKARCSGASQQEVILSWYLWVSIR